MFNDMFGGVQSQEYRDYIASRSENLVSNGDGFLGNNYNFSPLVYDSSDAYSGRGSFKATGYPGIVLSSEFLPVSPDKTYEMSAWIKEVSTSAPRVLYAGLALYDIDGNQIISKQFLRSLASDTTLAVPLNVGDTTVTVANAVSGWANGSAYRNLQIFGYKNAGGTLYDRDVNPYTRYVMINAWNVDGDINTGTGVITLNAPLAAGNGNPAGGAWPVGTKVSHGSDGSDYSYCMASNLTLTTGSWIYTAGRISGINLTGGGNSYKFFPGTARVKIVLLPNYNAANTNVTLINSVRFTPLNTPALSIFTLSTLPSVVQYGAGAMIYVSNATGGAVPCYSNGTNWLRVTDGTVVN